MPTLNWIGKKAVENHHREVPFHLLKDVPGLSVGDPGTGNLLVEGDNLLALKALLPYYAGQVKCIYIDPPYNTGNENWVYNDNVNSPEIRQWLGKVVGGELDDLTRHDKWLCMMYPRLSLLHQFLRKDGVIFISIDENEMQNLLVIMDEIFGENCLEGIICWRRRHNQPNDKTKMVAKVAEFIVAFSKNKGMLKSSGVGKVALTGDFSNPDNDSRGDWASKPWKVGSGQSGSRYKLKSPSGKVYDEEWMGDEDTFKRLLADKRIFFPKSGQGMPRKKYFKFEREEEGQCATNWWPHDVFGHNQGASDMLEDIFGKRNVFDNSKPVQLIISLLQIANVKSEDIVLDSFVGSGTTGHAVLDLNNQDGGNRKFILVEIDQKIAREISAERIKRVVQGYKNSRGEKVKGLGGGFRFCQLSDPLFDEKGNIRSSVRFAELARHVYFTETGEPLPKQSKATSPLLGTYNNVAVCLLYNGILKDKSPDGGNVLTTGVLSHLPKHKGPKVIYGTACRIGASRLRQQNITFKQLPYKLKVDAL